MNSKYISSKLFTLFLKDYNSLDRLSYYIAMKKAHKSGNKLNIKELSAIIGCSYNSTKFHLDLFQKLEIIKVENNKLHFVSTRKLTWSRGTKHLIEQNKVVKRKLYLEFEQTQVKELKKELKAFVLLNSLCKQGYIQKKNEQNPNPLHAGISAKGLGKKINRSVSTGRRLIKRLQEDNIIKVTPKFEFLGQMTKEEFDFARNNFLIPQWSKFNYCHIFNKGNVTRQTYSEMEIVKKTFVCKMQQTINGDTLIKAQVHHTVKTKEQCNLPFFMVRPEGFFTINYLYKLGYSKYKAKKVFIPSIESVFGTFPSKNIKLMAFSDLKRIQERGI